MGSYKDDEDRFHAMCEQRKHELRAKESEECLINLLEARGVDTDRLFETIEKNNKLFERIGLDRDTRRGMTVKAIMRAAGFPLDDPAVSILLPAVRGPLAVR